MAHLDLGNGTMTTAQRIYGALFFMVVVVLGVSGMDLVSYGGITVLFVHRVVIGLFLIAFLWIIAETNTIAIPVQVLPVALLFGLVCIHLLLSVRLPSERALQSAATGIQILFMLSFYIAIVTTSLDQRQVTRLLRCWLLVVLAVTVYGFYQTFALNFDLPFRVLTIGDFSTQTGTIGDYWRPASVFREPGHYNSFVLPGYVLSTLLYAKGQLSSILFASRRLNAMAIAFFWLNFILIASLSGFLSVTALLFLVFVLNKKSRKYLVAIFVCGIAAYTGISLLGEQAGFLSSILRRVNNLIQMFTALATGGTVRGGSQKVRLLRAVWNFKVWLQNPIFGAGINQAQFIAERFSYPSWYTGKGVLPASHNSVLFVMSSFGLIGLLLYSWFLSGLVRTLANVRESSRYQRTLSRGFLYIIVVVVTTSFFQFPFHYAYRWFLFGLATVVGLQSINE